MAKTTSLCVLASISGKIPISALMITTPTMVMVLSLMILPSKLSTALSLRSSFLKRLHIILRTYLLQHDSPNSCVFLSHHRSHEMKHINFISHPPISLILERWKFSNNSTRKIGKTAAKRIGTLAGREKGHNSDGDGSVNGNKRARRSKQEMSAGQEGMGTLSAVKKGPGRGRPSKNNVVSGRNGVAPSSTTTGSRAEKKRAVSGNGLRRSSRAAAEFATQQITEQTVRFRPKVLKEANS
ncbi:hypothetical protein GGR51DRAFT_488870 [Nemania sp. FL0031]|nr:hypothetical protein GGR51DRAFT_488870 [Nemania sp. FL0031]